MSDIVKDFISEISSDSNTKKKTEFLKNASDTLLHYNIEDVSDGYHTYKELYHHRALLFRVICGMFPDRAWKSLKHDDDKNNPMYDGMFIIGIETPKGQATYHYDIDPYWNIFYFVQEIDHAPIYDGHTPEDAINRLQSLILI